MRSFRTRKLIAALEAAGHTEVRVRWEPIGPAMEMCGHSGGYFFKSKQRREEPLGTSLREALANVRLYPPTEKPCAR
jgi:hypothetical protein